MATKKMAPKGKGGYLAMLAKKANNPPMKKPAKKK